MPTYDTETIATTDTINYWKVLHHVSTNEPLKLFLFLMSPLDFFVKFLWWNCENIKRGHLRLAVVAYFLIDEKAEGEKVEKKFAGGYLWIFSSSIKDKVQDGLSDQIL